jgi:hypothetical protein
MVTERQPTANGGLELWERRDRAVAPFFSFCDRPIGYFLLAPFGASIS